MFMQTKEYTKYNIVNVNLKKNNRMILICKSGHVSRMILIYLQISGITASFNQFKQAIINLR
jgi:hypothetical protein